ncbi:Flp pilus assembly protein CpaB [Azospirillum canadense]|uniref:Flp pilus assembly protein CpaB n=1 Tax=Azospirillum canadense TaxID=403962 RepID=UPI002227BAA6|nr:Flp pilus assembly protein CpaB [Azospirillum canadense]MCW2238705.1 pilus assembly protein CpaB [Azospirillum canadense]
MRQRALLMLALACVTGGTAVYLARGWIARQTQPQVVALPTLPPATTITVVVAKIPLKFGDELSRESLREMAWPADAAPEGSFRTMDELLGGERRVALREMGPNEVVLKARVSGYGGRATLSAVIAEGMRAATIRVNDVQGVAGFVLPGDLVDVVFTRPEDPTPGVQSAPMTDVLLQGVKVLAVDQTADDQKDKPIPAKAVTLEVTPDDAQRLALAGQVGSLGLALRQSGGVQTASVDTIRIGNLVNRAPLAISAAAVASAPRPEPDVGPLHASVRIVRALEESTQDVPYENRPAAKPAPRRPDGSKGDRVATR